MAAGNERKVYVGDTGTLIRFRFSKDESFPAGPHTAKIAYRKPSGVEGEWSATVTTDPTPEYAAYVEYTTQQDDLDEAGVWALQVEITSQTWSGLSDTVPLDIHGRFE